MGLLFTYLMTYGGAAVALFNPWIGVLVYISFAILVPPSLWYWSVPMGNYSRIIAFAVIAGWIGKGFGNWNFGRGQAILMMLCCFLGWSVVSAAFADNLTVGFGFFEQKSKIVLPCLIAMTLCDSVARLKSLAWTIAVSHGYLALEFNRAYFEGYNRLEENGHGFMDNNSITIALVTAVGFTFFLGISQRVLWRKLLFFFFAALLTHAVFFSYSRGGMVSLIAVGVVSAVILPKQPKHYVMFAFAAALAFRMAGPQVMERFFTTFAEKEERDASADSRVVMWGICWEMMQESPIVGIGPDHFTLKVHDYNLQMRGKEAHSLWLQIGAELGFPGLLFLALFYFLTIVRILKFLRKTPNSEQLDPFVRFLPHMVIASLTGFVLAAQFVSLEGLEAPYYIAILAACFLKLQPQIAPAFVPQWMGPVPHHYHPYQRPFFPRPQVTRSEWREARSES